MKRRVVVTGMGCVSPFGVGVDTLWENLKKGNSGIKKLTVVYSKEEPIKTDGALPGSVSFTPPVAGYLMAGHVINKLRVGKAYPNQP